MAICPSTPALCHYLRIILLVLGICSVLASALIAYLLVSSKRKAQTRLPVLAAGLFGLGAVFIISAFFLAPYLLSLLVSGDFSSVGTICRPCGFDPWPFPK